MHDLKQGDRVQMTRLGIRRQNGSAQYEVTEATCGIFVRYVDKYPHWDQRHGAFDYAKVVWMIEGTVGHTSVERKVQAIYLEPYGTKR